MTDWHRIDDPDNPPPKGVPLLTWTDLDGLSDDEFMVMVLAQSGEWAGGGFKDLRPTHWQPLPPPPDDV